MSGFKIEAIWAYVAVDPDDGDEGVVAYETPGGWLPLIAADEKRLNLLRPMAEEIAREGVVEIRLVHFYGRSTVEILPSAE